MARRATERLAVSTSTSKASRLRSTRSSVLQPIEPVDPRRESRRGWLAERGDVDATDACEKVMSERARRSPEVQEGGQQHREQAVHTVEDTTMAGDNVPRILHPETALEPGFQKGSALGDDGEDHAADDQERGVAAKQAGRQHADQRRRQNTADQEIGSASCREKRVSVRVDLGGRRIIKKKKTNHSTATTHTDSDNKTTITKK